MAIPCLRSVAFQLGNRAIVLGLLLTGVCQAVGFDDATSAKAADVSSGRVVLAQADPDSQEAEQTFWDAVKDSGDADMIESYLASFPDGAFASEARAKLNELRGTPGLGVAVAHPFTGRWGVNDLSCKGGFGSLIFGGGNTANYTAIGDHLIYTCRSATITRPGGQFTYSASCEGRRLGSQQDVVSEGRLELHRAGDRLTGRAPDGLKLEFNACD